MYPMGMAALDRSDWPGMSIFRLDVSTLKNRLIHYHGMCVCGVHRFPNLPCAWSCIFMLTVMPCLHMTIKLCLVGVLGSFVADADSNAAACLKMCTSNSNADFV